MPGILFLEIDGLALPVLRRAMRDGNAPVMARWVEQGTHRLVEWETDFSSQTGASQTGILLGSNDDVPAFRWVDKPTGRVYACSGPADCAEIEARLANGKGLLRNGGASRGNLFSGEADHMILTASRMEAEQGANPGYRAFFANGFNVTRVLVLVFWEVVLEWMAALRAIRRDVRPRGHRGGIYPLLRAAMCVFVRDLIVYGVISDMIKGRPAVYATFSSYDEVAHHSGLERADTLEALRKLDQQFGRIERARKYAPRPYEIVVLSDHGQTQGATFLQRNGYGLADLVERSLTGARVAKVAGGDEQHQMVGNALGEATGTKQKPKKNDVSDRQVVVLGSGNLGLVYLMEEPRRLTLEEIERAAPGAHPGAARAPARRLPARVVGRARAGRARPLGHPLSARRPGGGRRPARGLLADGGRPPPAHGRLRPRRRHHGQQLLRPPARRGLRVRGADLVPRRDGRAADAAVRAPSGDAPRRPTEPLVGAASVHDLLLGWRIAAPGRRIGDRYARAQVPHVLASLPATIRRRRRPSWATPARTWSSSSTPSELRKMSAVFSAPRWLRDLGIAAWLLTGVALLVVGLTWVLGMTQTITGPVLAGGVVAVVASPGGRLAPAPPRCRVPPARSSS